MNKKLRLLTLWMAMLLVLFSACKENPETSTGSNTPETGTQTTEIRSTGTESGEHTTDPSIPSSGPEQTFENTGTGTEQNTDTDTENTPGSSSKDTDVPSTPSTQKPSTPQTSNSNQQQSSWTPAKPDDTPTTGSSPLSPADGDPYGLAWIKQQPNGAVLLQAYNALVQGAESLQATISFPTDIPVDQLKTLWYCYYDDHPEHFWVDTGFSYSYSGTKAHSIAPNYLMSSGEKASAQVQLNRAVSDLLKGLSGSMTPYDLEKAIHDRLVLSCSYRNGTYAHTAYGALVQKSAVCDGYARAFQILCKEVGIQALLVRGKSVNPSTQQQEGHAWNIVKISGKYYHVDVTWDDAGEPETQQEIHYAWFNVTTSQIRQDHTMDNDSYSLPTCTATDHNYYIKNNRIINTLNVDDLLSRTYLQNGAYHCNVYVKNPGNSDQWFDQNLETLASRMGLNGYSFSVTFVGNEIYYTIIPQ